PAGTTEDTGADAHRDQARDEEEPDVHEKVGRGDGAVGPQVRGDFVEPRHDQAGAGGEQASDQAGGPPHESQDHVRPLRDARPRAARSEAPPCDGAAVRASHADGGADGPHSVQTPTFQFVTLEFTFVPNAEAAMPTSPESSRPSALRLCSKDTSGPLAQLGR